MVEGVVELLSLVAFIRFDVVHLSSKNFLDFSAECTFIKLYLALERRVDDAGVPLSQFNFS